MLGAFQRLVENLTYGDLRGRAALGQFVARLLKSEGGALRAEIGEEQGRQVYENWFNANEQDVRPYIELLLSVLGFVEGSERPNKSFYFDLVRVTLSPKEKTLLFYHARSVHEHRALRTYIERYALFRDMDKESLTQQSRDRAKWYSPGAYSEEVAIEERDFARRMAQAERDHAGGQTPSQGLTP